METWCSSGLSLKLKLSSSNVLTAKDPSECWSAPSLESKCQIFARTRNVSFILLCAYPSSVIYSFLSFPGLLRFQTRPMAWDSRSVDSVLLWSMLLGEVRDCSFHHLSCLASSAKVFPSPLCYCGTAGEQLLHQLWGCAWLGCGVTWSQWFPCTYSHFS